MNSMLIGEKNCLDEELLKGQALIWKHTFNFIHTMSLKCAIELAIPDTIHNHGKPMTLPDLVAGLPIHPSKAPYVHRLMRILTHSGFFVLHQQGYVLTHASRLLLSDNPFSMKSFVVVLLEPRMMKPWESLTSWFKNDEPTPFEALHGKPIWEYGAQDPEFASLFGEAMASDSRLVASILAGSCKGVFQGVSTLVDVGGGTGTMARSIAGAFPDMECTVFDLPHVVAEGLEGPENLKFLGGDMFQAIPPADAILLKWILHDWSDENCEKILGQCKKALASNGGRGKVIIIDMVVQTDNNDRDSIDTQLFMDLEVMTLYASKERSEEDWGKLFSSAGFGEYKISPMFGLRSLIEVYPYKL